MNEEMIERAISIIEDGEADVTTGLGTFTADERDALLRALEAARAAHSVIAGKVAELEAERDALQQALADTHNERAELERALQRIAQPVFIVEPAGSRADAWQVALGERIEIARTALAQTKGTDR